MLEVGEEAFFVLGEERGWGIGRRDLVFGLEEFGGESWRMVSLERADSLMDVTH